MAESNAILVLVKFFFAAPTVSYKKDWRFEVKAQNISFSLVFDVLYYFPLIRVPLLNTIFICSPRKIPYEICKTNTSISRCQRFFYFVWNIYPKVLFWLKKLCLPAGTHYDRNPHLLCISNKAVWQNWLGV